MFRINVKSTSRCIKIKVEMHFQCIMETFVSFTEFIIHIKQIFFYDVKIIFYYIEKGVSFQKNKQNLLLIFIIIECQITQID